MRHDFLPFLLAACLVLVWTGCQSSSELTSPHPAVHGYFKLDTLTVNGTEYAFEPARPWQYGYLLDSEDAKQYLAEAEDFPILFCPTSYSHGWMVRLDIYPQRPEGDAVLRLVEIKRITESGVIENPGRLTATSGEDQQEIPFPVANSAHLTAAFEGKAPAGSIFEFKIGLLVGNQEINIDFKAERLGDKRGIEPWRIAPGGAWPWFRYLLGLD